MHLSSISIIYRNKTAFVPDLFTVWIKIPAALWLLRKRNMHFRIWQSNFMTEQRNENTLRSFGEMWSKTKEQSQETLVAIRKTVCSSRFFLMEISGDTQLHITR